MNRIPRLATAFALSAALLAAATPAAHARSLAPSQASNPIIAGSWFDAALAWVGDLMAGAPHAQGVRSMTKTFSPIPIPVGPPTGSGVGIRPMGCSTIDPNGALGCGGI